MLSTFYCNIVTAFELAMQGSSVFIMIIANCLKIFVKPEYDNINCKDLTKYAVICKWPKTLKFIKFNKS